MRLSASTRLLDKICKPFTNEVSILKRYGFEGIDFDLNHKLPELLGDRWLEKIERVAEDAYENDMPIIQTHLPYSFVAGAGPGPVEAEAIKQAIMATEILGARYAVFHAISPKNVEEGLPRTYEFYMPMVEFGAKHNVELLVENMPNFCTYPITAEALCGAADKLGIGVCWDFGHPNVNKYHLPNDQRDELRMVGSRLKALHVNDNAGGRPDEHLPPYMGSVDWDTHVPVLKEIGYDGDFNYEVLPRNVPDYMIPNIADYLIKVGRKLIELCD